MRETATTLGRTMKFEDDLLSKRRGQEETPGIARDRSQLGHNVAM
jgi:hypothetical protein